MNMRSRLPTTPYTSGRPSTVSRPNEAIALLRRLNQRGTLVLNLSQSYPGMASHATRAQAKPPDKDLASTIFVTKQSREQTDARGHASRRS